MFLACSFALAIATQSFLIPVRNRGIASKVEDMCLASVRQEWSLSRLQTLLIQEGCNLESWFDPSVAEVSGQTYRCSIEFYDLDPFTRTGTTVEIRVDQSSRVTSANTRAWIAGL